MTEPLPPAAPAATTPSVWEDLMDVWYAPSEVFRRRANGDWVIALVVLAVVMTVIAVAGHEVMRPLVDGEIARGMDASFRAHPEMTADQRATALSVATKMQNVYQYLTLLIIPISVSIVGLVLWMVGKLFGAQETAGAAVMIATFAYFPRALDSLLRVVQAMLLDTSPMKGLAAVSVSAARFMDPAAVSPALYVLGSRIDLFIFWETALLTIGLGTIGKISRDKALIAGGVMWLIGTLFPVLRAMA